MVISPIIHAYFFDILAFLHMKVCPPQACPQFPVKIAKEEEPDLILLDILMPEMDGYQTLEKLKEDDQTKSIPVLMLTAKSQVGDVTKAVNLGAIDYIVKPFSHVVLLEKIHKALE